MGLADGDQSFVVHGAPVSCRSTVGGLGQHDRQWRQHLHLDTDRVELCQAYVCVEVAVVDRSIAPAVLTDLGLAAGDEDRPGIAVVSGHVGESTRYEVGVNVDHGHPPGLRPRAPSAVGRAGARAAGLLGSLRSPRRHRLIQHDPVG